MGIKSVSVSVIRLPLKKPFTVSYETYVDMPSIIVKVETDCGLIGFGEAVPDQHVTGETWESTYQNLVHYLVPSVLNESPFNIEQIHNKMDQVLYGMPTAKAAIDIACYDLMGKMAGQPVYNLLGGKFHPLLSLPHVIGIGSPEEMSKEAVLAVDQGCEILKIKVGTDPDLDILRISSIRQAVGEKIRLRVDANQGWINSATALYVLTKVEDCKIDWIEQPVIANDIHALAEVRRKTMIPVMADEGLHGPTEMRQLISLNAAGLINIKLMKCGGLYPALKLINQAEMAGMECIIGSMIESSIATAAGAHLSIAKKNIIGNEMVAPRIFNSDLSPLNYDKHSLHLNEMPGLGLNVNESLIKELSIASNSIMV